jgi:CBS domain-containing protein
MKLVKHILQEKGSTVHSVPPHTIMFDALKIMAEKGVGALLVTDGNEIEGIISERDYARKVVLEGKSSREMQVEDIMSGCVYYIKPENSVEECMAIMTDKRVRHLPVLDKGKVAGIISIGDVVKAVIDEQNFTIDQLVSYIKGT